LKNYKKYIKSNAMKKGSNYPFADQGRRLRLLRQAERYASGYAFAVRLGWPQPSISQFETGLRRVPMDKALELRRMVPGFDPVWLWEGDTSGLSFDLRKRIEEEEAKEAPSREKAGRHKTTGR
jgi:hypothetical protein